MKLKLTEIKLNPNNPRVIKDDKFKKLVTSITEFPEMLKLRPLVIDEDNVLLGGNMRYRALLEAGVKEVEVTIAKGLTEEQKREFIIKDNVSYGEWDFDILANEWDKIELEAWGLDIFNATTDIDMDKFFTPNDEQSEADKFKIVLEYTETEYNEVTKRLTEIGGSKENVIYNLLFK
jgi:hypothetical protein